MKTMQSGVLALLLLCGFVSCKKDISSTADLTQTKARPATISTQVDEVVLQTGCPQCAKNFTPQTETAATNAVLKLDGGVLSFAGTTTITTIPATKEEMVVDNVKVTVSHDAKNVYFTLERSNGIGEFGNIRFYSPAVIPVPTTGNGNFGVGDDIKKIQVIRSRVSLSACSEINFSFHVGGGGSTRNGAGPVTTLEAIKYVLRDLCSVPTCIINAGDYRTQTRGYWANKNGQAFLTANPSLFNFTIGDGTNTKSFADPASVKTYLDGNANGTPGVLPYGGTFGAQVLTLAINLKADNQVADFSKAEGKVANLVVSIDDADVAAHSAWKSLQVFNGKTVQEIFDIAQKVLGGTSSEYSPSKMNEIVTAINENFDDGTIDNGLLSCGK